MKNKKQNLTSNEKLKLEKEIEYWSKHLDLDRFNYSKAHKLYIEIIIIYLTLFILVITFFESFREFTLFLSLIIFLFVIVILYLLYLIQRNKYKKEMEDNNISWIIRERMIQQRYEKLYNISKDELNGEFQDLKSIYKKPIPNLREFLIKQYYKDKKFL